LAVYFLLHFPADCSGWALPTTLLCEVRTFLGALRQRGDPGDSSLPNCTGVYVGYGMLVTLTGESLRVVELSPT
jgi:hypothetical protein